MARSDLKRSVRAAQAAHSNPHPPIPLIVDSPTSPKITAQVAATGPLTAVQHIRRMRGGTQPHLLRASDGHLYVTKFQNNPCHVRVLANEFLAARLGQWLGLPMPPVEIIEVPQTLIADTPPLHIKDVGMAKPCSSGPQVASRYVGESGTDRVFDSLPATMFHTLLNPQALVSALAFDKWTGNCDRRQAVFTRKGGQGGYHISLIDHHYCFDGGRWSFPDEPLMGTCDETHLYSGVTGWDSFEPILSRIEQIDCAALWSLAQGVPPEWQGHDIQALTRLVEALYQRRLLVRSLILNLRDSSPHLFPNWRNRASKQNRTLVFYPQWEDETNLGFA